MRTTLTIDDDLLAAAKSLAQARSVTVGRVVSDLARKGLSVTLRQSARNDNGFPVFSIAPDARPITPEDVRNAEEDG